MKRALIIIPTALFALLAVLGMGGVSPFISDPALIALVVVFALLVGVSFFAGGNLSAGVREHRDNRWVIAAVGVLGFAAAYLPPFTDRVGFWTIDGETVRWIGVALYAAGGALRIWPVFVLGDRFSGLVAIQPGHALVTDGIYRVVRNPSYLGLLVNSLGWALAFRSVAGVVLAALLVPPLVARMRSEERLLREQFGAEYDAYFARTWRLVPWIY